MNAPADDVRYHCEHLRALLARAREALATDVAELREDLDRMQRELGAAELALQLEQLGHARTHIEGAHSAEFSALGDNDRLDPLVTWFEAQDEQLGLPLPYCDD